MNAFTLVSRLQATLQVMKSARDKKEPMSIWESDILAVQDAIAALTQSPQETTTGSR